METQTSRTTSGTSGPAAPGSPHIRDLSSLRNGESGSAFRGNSRARGGRSNRGGRGGGRPSSTLGSAVREERLEGRLHSDTAAPQTEALTKGPASMVVLDKPTGRLERSAKSKSKPPSKRTSRVTPTLVIAPPPSETSPAMPSNPRSSNRRYRSHQQSKAPLERNLKPPSSQAPLKLPRARNGSTYSPVAIRKDIPPHLAASHEAEVRHDIEALVERVRAVAMAENRPTTPGSHIDWAGEEDDSLPDLDDWGVITTNNTVNGEQNEGISPILGDALKQLPEPRLDIEREVSYNRDMETYSDADAGANEEFNDPAQTHFSTDPAQTDSLTTPISEQSSDVSTSEVFPESPSVPLATDTKSPEHPPLLPREEVDPPLKSSESSTDDDLISTCEGISGSIHAPSCRELAAIEPRSRSSDERSLSASIHAPAGALESHPASSLLPDQSIPVKNHSYSRSHGRSHTESRPSQAPRFSRSGASSPLGQHVYTHSRNHSSPPTGGPSHRAHHTSRPVITGEAISRLARTIGGLGQVPRTQGIPL
ncbi:hypothetical protein SCLCIDRAFT_1208894 [Scleroderma citrinum Foug A]|uniref:Uncharacterized protein n=1 Tax=Scleroderma citrinum Foug A TaxID=1036808 RepID=A0A0C3AUR5_9AGAM|nr:hypothetical protein SCLCIDRAFT_1208894 [Scleroderma citrinum Foug A]